MSKEENLLFAVPVNPRIILGRASAPRAFPRAIGSSHGSAGPVETTVPAVMVPIG